MDRAAGEIDGAAEQQPLARARHRDVEDPVLLLSLGAAAALAQQLVLQRGFSGPLAQAREAQAHEIAVDDQIGHAEVRLAPEVGDAHDRELQALGRVHAHQAHGIGIDVVHRCVGLSPI